MGRKGLRYRLSVYLSISLLAIVVAVVVGRHELVPLFVGMYLPVAVLTEVGMVRIISHHGGVENARRKGFRGRIAVYLLEVACWVAVAYLVGWRRFVPIILAVLLPSMILFDLLFIYRILSWGRRDASGTGALP